MRTAYWILLSLLARPVCAEIIQAVRLDHTAPIPAAESLASTLATYQGMEYTLAQGDEITSLVLAHYQSHDYPVVVVSLPESAMNNGTLTVEVTEGRVSKITQTGHRWLAPPDPRLQPGDLLTGTRLQQSLDDLNRNPFHRATVAATPGASAELAELRFEMPQEVPFSAWLSFTNDGIKPLGQARWLSGLSVGDLFKFDNTLTVQGQMAADYEMYHTVLGEWKSRLPWHHELSLTGAVVRTQSPAVDDISIDGDAWFASAKYLVPWRSSVTCAGETWLSFDTKQFTTDVLFGGSAALQQPVDVTTFTLGEKLLLTHPRDTLELIAEAVYSPGNLWGNSSDADYAAGLPGASSQFFYLRGQATWTHSWANQASLLTTVGGQWADGTLLASEAYYLVGANAVRGYSERSLLGSSGVRGSVELRSPFTLLPGLPRTQAQALIFADAGHTWTEQAITDTPISLGAGFRAQLGNWGQLRCEGAWPLTDGLAPRINVQMTLFF